MGKTNAEEIDEAIKGEDVNFIYVNPVSKENEGKVKTIKILMEKHNAEVIYDERCEEDWILFSGEKITDEEWKELALHQQDPETYH